MANATGCPNEMPTTSNGIFQDSNPLNYALPLLIVQICLVVVVTRALAFLLRPLRQPRVIAEIIGGILLGPSALGRSTAYLHAVFPQRSLTVLETLADVGLLYFLFLVGLELDPKALRRTGKKALIIAVAGIGLPLLLGIGTSYVLRATICKGVNGPPFLVFMAVALSITAFPVLARILAELKLLTTDVGRIAMSAAAVNDVAAWILLALAIALSSSGKSPLISLWVLLIGVGFIAFMVTAVRPVLVWMGNRCPEGEPVKEVYICATLTLVLAAGFITDMIGIHALFGAFIVGLIVPKEGPFAGVLVEKIEDLVSGLFLPLYFVASGLKTNVATISGGLSWALLALVIFTACFGKIFGTFAVALACKVPFRESLALGLLMNTKGLVELIVLNIGKDRKVLNEQTFAIMVLMALFTTFITTPLVTAFYKPARKATPYKHRTIQRRSPDSQLRILVCLHSTRNVPTIINLIEASRGTRSRRPVCVYAMHLMELSERSSAILMCHKARNNGLPFWNKVRPESDQIIVAFEAYQQLSSVSVRPMTAISDLTDMHEDICTSAEQKRAAIIILPYHKHPRLLDGSLEPYAAGFHTVNVRVLENAPCSVGILVDRGLGGGYHVSASDVSHSITVLFFGGPDDREALSYAARMAEHPGIKLTVVRFLVAEAPDARRGGTVRIVLDGEELTSDEEFLVDFKASLLSSDSIDYLEKEVKGKAEIVAAIKEHIRCNLILVGRSARCDPLTERTDSPELGPVGSLLVSPEFPMSASVLVVQQYNRMANLMSPSTDDPSETPKHPGYDSES
ncbi:cation/H(+) antiporter 19-like [Nymphaea colorata]|nr:cation/H(+) antiporter 19-like [Nymphaea colorata]